MKGKTHKYATQAPGGWFRILLRYLSRLLAAIVFLAAAILIMIQTPPGKRLLADGLTHLASSPGTTIRFRRISGFIPFRIGLGELRLGDRDGDWMVLENIRVRLDPLELLSFRLWSDRTTVGRATWHRLPKGAEGKVRRSGGGFTPADIPSFRVNRLAVERFETSEALTGRKLKASLEGKVSNDILSGPRVELVIRPPERPVDKLTVSALAAADLSRLELTMEMEEETGGMARSLFFPEDPGPLSLRLEASGPSDRVRTKFALDLPERFELSADLTADLENFLADGEVGLSITRPPLPGWGGTGKLTARLASAGGGQDLSLRFSARDAEAAGVRAEELKGDVYLTDLFREIKGEVSLKASHLSTPRRDADDPDPGDLIRRLSGRLVISGTGFTPRADLDLQLRGYTIPGLVLAPGERRNVNITGSLTDNRLKLDLEGEGERGFELAAEFAADADFSTAPLSLAFPKKGELRGRLTSELPLSFLNNLLALTRQTLGGRAHVDLELGGTWETPEPRGTITVSEGEYQNLNSGTILQELSARWELDGDRLILDKLTARTPRPERPLLLSWARFIPGIEYTPLVDRAREITQAGRLTLAGSTRISAAEGYPSDYTLKIENALLADMDLVTVIASGEINLAGSLKESLVEGRVRIRHAEGRIPGRMGTAVPEVEVIEINKPEEKEFRTEARPRPFLENVTLDLRLTAADNVIVKGRGLDSEWEAAVSIRGRASKPEIRGGLNLLDGTFVFMGEEMRLADCTVMMDGEYPPVPQLKINARIVKRDIIMDLQVIGPATDPEVMISSQPPYPDDEILARLLFGRPVSQLSGLQALQIANGLRTIQGQASFFDLLTSWTTFLGTIHVDFTDLEGAEDQTAVRVRWSLSRNFYIENQASIESPDNLFLARWEIIRNLQLRVQSGYGMLGDAAYLHWQMNY